jgi:nitrite reductase/ring-hydroxylating ferredoxin subunit
MDGQSSPGARQAAAPRKRFLAKSVPYEGENGLFSQSWFPICLSTDVPKGQVDGKVIIFRGEDGVARVMSAYCPHLGSDLSIGKVVGNNIQCAFHMFEMNSDGYCVKTGIGDDPPKNACIYVFPTRERWGVIFAFNGDEAPWELPNFIYPDEELLISVSPPIEFNADPWVFSCNTPDVALHWGDKPISWDLGIHGTSIFIQDGTLDGQWFGITVPFGMPTPGKSVAYFINVVHKGSGSESDLAKAKEWLRVTTNLEVTFGSQDLDILNTIHLRPGALTKSDKFLGKFLTFLREYPRAHPSADFIR